MPRKQLDERQWTIRSWIAAFNKEGQAKICERTFYNLSAEHRPVALHIGGKVCIIESPDEWRRRLCRDNGGRIPTRRSAAHAQVAA